MTRKEKLLRASFRLERYQGKYRVEVLDTTNGHWYVVASGFKTFFSSIAYCRQFVTGEPNKKEVKVL